MTVNATAEASPPIELATSDPAEPRGDMITAIGATGELYPIDKLEAHRRDVHHLAISVFLFCGGRLLMQQRAEHKYHSGGLWANTCCSHPRWNESLQACAERRLFEELGCRIALQRFGRIDYRAPVGALFENEDAHCYVGYMDDAAAPIPFNPDEVQAVNWLSLPELQDEIASSPDRYTPWFRIYLHQHFELIAAVSHA